jgi:hypothetical protein
MTATGDVLNQMVTTLVRVTRRPGAVLIRLAGSAVGVFALLGLAYVAGGSGWRAWVPLVLAGVLAVPIVTLAVRRERLQAQTAGLDPHRTVIANTGTATVYDGAQARDDEMESLSAAMAEGAMRTARFFPRIEAAQRAGLLAAGGPVNAPYLQDDLRVTIAALVGTLAAIPLGTIGSIVTAILLVSR